jgi:hypothetical protein
LFFIEASGLQPNDQPTLRLTSGDGREMQLDNSTTYQGTFGQTDTRIYQPRFTPGSEVSRVSLEVIASRGLEFEFLIDPKEIRPADSPNL